MPHARRFSYRSLVVAGLLLFVGALLATPAHAQPAPPTAQPTPPPASADNGFGNLTARWWTWAFAQPAVDVGGTNTNPILDSTGAYASEGQKNGIGPANKYFFLTGNFGGTMKRTVTVPKGKTLFFPVINFEADNATVPPRTTRCRSLRR